MMLLLNILQDRVIWLWQIKITYEIITTLNIVTARV